MNASINAFKNYFEKLEKEMLVINPNKVSIIKQLKNVSLKNATGKLSDEKTRVALEKILIKFGINPSAIRRNEQYALTVGLAKPPFDYDGNNLTDLVEHGSKPGVNLLAGARTKRTKGILEDFKGIKSVSSNKGLLDDLGVKSSFSNNLVGELQGKTQSKQSGNGLLNELSNKVKSKSQPVNIMGLGKNVKSNQKSLNLVKHVKSPKFDLLGELSGKHKVQGLNFNVTNNPKESVIGAFKNLSSRERKKNVREKGIIGALAGAGKR